MECLIPESNIGYQSNSAQAQKIAQTVMNTKLMCQKLTCMTSEGGGAVLLIGSTKKNMGENQDLLNETI